MDRIIVRSVEEGSYEPNRVLYTNPLHLSTFTIELVYNRIHDIIKKTECKIKIMQETQHVDEEIVSLPDNDDNKEIVALPDDIHIVDDDIFDDE